jgi:hypothetical protein
MLARPQVPTRLPDKASRREGPAAVEPLASALEFNDGECLLTGSSFGRRQHRSAALNFHLLANRPAVACLRFASNPAGRERTYGASRKDASLAVASFLPKVLRTAMAGKCSARGRVLPASQLYMDCPDAPTSSPQS